MEHTDRQTQLKLCTNNQSYFSLIFGGINLIKCVQSKELDFFRIYKCFLCFSTGRSCVRFPRSSQSRYVSSQRARHVPRQGRQTRSNQSHTGRYRYFNKQHHFYTLCNASTLPSVCGGGGVWGANCCRDLSHSTFF